MENSSPVSSLDSSDEHNIKFVILGVVIATVYTLPLVAFLIAFVIPAFLILMAFGSGENFKAIYAVLFVVMTSISLVIIGVTAFLSGRAAYRSANESGTIWNAVIGTFISIVVFCFGAFVFSFAGIFLVGFLYEPFAASEESMIGTLPFGVALGLVVTYIVAVVCGALTHHILARRFAKQKNILKSEGGS